LLLLLLLQRADSVLSLQGLLLLLLKHQQARNTLQVISMHCYALVWMLLRLLQLQMPMVCLLVHCHVLLLELLLQQLHALQRLLHGSFSSRQVVLGCCLLAAA
jgi:hypothetical protein